MLTSCQVASKSPVYHGSATSPLCPACASSSEHFPSGSPPQMRAMLLRFIYTGLPSSSRLVAAEAITNSSSHPDCRTKSFITYSAIGLRQMLPWHTNNTLIIFLYLHLNLVFLLKRLIFQGFPTFEFSFLFKVSSQIFSYFLMFFPAILVNPLVKQASLPTGFFNYSLSDILLPLHHQNSHGCKCSRLH